GRRRSGSLGAFGRRCGARPGLGCFELVLDEIAPWAFEGPIEGRLQQAGVVELGDLLPGAHPHSVALLAPTVELAGVMHRQLLVWGSHVSAMDHRVPLGFLPEDLPNPIVWWRAFAHGLVRATQVAPLDAPSTASRPHPVAA